MKNLPMLQVVLELRSLVLSITGDVKKVGRTYQDIVVGTGEKAQKLRAHNHL